MRAGGIIRIENLTSRGVFVCATPFTGGLRRLYFLYIVHPPVEEIISMIPANIVYIILGLIFSDFS